MICLGTFPYKVRSAAAQDVRLRLGASSISDLLSVLRRHVIRAPTAPTATFGVSLTNSRLSSHTFPQPTALLKPLDFGKEAPVP